MLFLAVFSIFSIVTNPAKFVLIFTLAVIFAIAGLAFWSGPQQYMNKIFQKQFLVRTVVLFGSMIGSLWFSLVNSSYIMSLIFCVIEFNAILLYFCNSFPLSGGLQQA